MTEPTADRSPLDLDAERETQMLPRINRAMVALHASDYAELVPLEYLPSVIAMITDGLGVPALVAEVAALRAELAKAKANECTALCGDVEQERDELRAELDAARAAHERALYDAHQRGWNERAELAAARAAIKTLEDQLLPDGA